jgi:hypothetical protein
MLYPGYNGLYSTFIQTILEFTDPVSIFMNSVSSEFAAVIENQIPERTKPPVFINQLVQDT